MLLVTLSAVIVLMLIAVAVVVFNLAKQGLSRPILYELPTGYRGWVEVYYESPTCPPERWRGLYRVIKISSSGRGCTSGFPPTGWAYHRPEYVDIDGTVTVPPLQLVSYSEQKKRYLIFVGTESELKGSWSTAPW